MKPSELRRLKDVLSGLRSQLELLWIVYFPNSSHEGRSNVEMWEQLWRKSNEGDLTAPFIQNVYFKWNSNTGRYESGNLSLTREYVEDGLNVSKD